MDNMYEKLEYYKKVPKKENEKTTHSSSIILKIWVLGLFQLKI